VNPPDLPSPPATLLPTRANFSALPRKTSRTIHSIVHSLCCPLFLPLVMTLSCPSKLTPISYQDYPLIPPRIEPTSQLLYSDCFSLPPIQNPVLPGGFTIPSPPTSKNSASMPPVSWFSRPYPLIPRLPPFPSESSGFLTRSSSLLLLFLSAGRLQNFPLRLVSYPLIPL